MNAERLLISITYTHVIHLISLKKKNVGNMQVTIEKAKWW